jgi:hypothetical protein
VDSSALLYEQVVECRVFKSSQEIALMKVRKHIVTCIAVPLSNYLVSHCSRVSSLVAYV